MHCSQILAMGLSRAEMRSRCRRRCATGGKHQAHLLGEMDECRETQGTRCGAAARVRPLGIGYWSWNSCSASSRNSLAIYQTRPRGKETLGGKETASFKGAAGDGCAAACQAACELVPGSGKRGRGARSQAWGWGRRGLASAGHRACLSARDHPHHLLSWSMFRQGLVRRTGTSGATK